MTQRLLEVVDLRVDHVDGPGGPVRALDGLSFGVDEGEFVSVVGPSGAGKTTLLRCIAGLTRPTAGEVLLDGTRMRGVPEGLAIVFQEYGRSLFPWLRVGDNVDLPLRHLGLSRSERRERVTTALAEVGLLEAIDRYPWQLSGGMQQRVAIARAVAYRPRLLLMDEPFASVDAQTRAGLQDTALAMWQAHRTTVIFVTHDIDESVYLADRVIVLSPRPATVAADVPVALSRPRDQIETRASDAFVALRADVARLLRGHGPRR